MYQPIRIGSLPGLVRDFSLSPLVGLEPQGEVGETDGAKVGGIETRWVPAEVVWAAR